MQSSTFRAAFRLLCCLLCAPAALAQRTLTFPDKCYQSGPNLVCADPSKSIYPGAKPVAPAYTVAPDGRAYPAQMPQNLTVEQLYHQGALFNAHHQYPQAAAYLLRCAELNDPRCETAIGLAYFNAKGVPQDTQKAVQWVGRGAYAGNRGAQYEIGYWYDDGGIFPHDAQKAFFWYMKSAQQNFATAETRVGIAYEFGDGVARSRPLAIAWLRRAAAQGDGFSHVLAGILSSPRTPARFQNEDALAAYMRTTMSRPAGSSPPRILCR